MISEWFKLKARFGYRHQYYTKNEGFHEGLLKVSSVNVIKSHFPGSSSMQDLESFLFAFTVSMLKLTENNLKLQA